MTYDDIERMIWAMATKAVDDAWPSLCRAPLRRWLVVWPATRTEWGRLGTIGEDDAVPVGAHVLEQTPIPLSYDKDRLVTHVHGLLCREPILPVER